MSGIHPFSLVRYSTMSCALHFTAIRSISGVTATLSSNFRRLPLPACSEDDLPESVLSTSIRTRPRSLRRIAMVMGRLPFRAGVAPWSNRNRTRGTHPASTALVRAYPSCALAFGGRMCGQAYTYRRNGSGGSRSDQVAPGLRASTRNRRLGRSGANDAVLAGCLRLRK